ncbi:MFS superfamily multidrug resistance transporter [Streptomyces sp. SPB074]|nr:MFS superfamily multidrug resistance transporter [Streptomyces sp. SPB074]
MPEHQPEDFPMRTVASADADTAQPPPRGKGVVPTLAFAGIVAAIMQTLVPPLLADLPRLLHSTPRQHRVGHHRHAAHRGRLRPGRRAPRRPRR